MEGGKKKAHELSRVLKDLGRMSLIFIGAEGIDRSARPLLENHNILDKHPLDEVAEIRSKYLPKIESLIDQINFKRRSEVLKILLGKEEIYDRLVCLGHKEGVVYKIRDRLSPLKIKKNCRRFVVLKPERNKVSQLEFEIKKELSEIHGSKMPQVMILHRSHRLSKYAEHILRSSRKNAAAFKEYSAMERAK